MGRTQKPKEDEAISTPQKGMKQSTGAGERAYMDGTFKALLAAIDYSGEHLEGKINPLSMELSLIRELGPI
ncbi:hypothetical protein NDU88_000299 [Pleurodeles waltl]|uniref:Uncharacterized protein n=1 Tax=Pleurodeles waltl TaxID=8319 RepID=A0AAV7S463_PLEWA|nr:hypothetical protein NDU88_000299 [Pleurodeles waltl]